MVYELWQGDLQPALGLTLTGITSLASASSVEFVMAQADGTARVTGTITDIDTTTNTVSYQWQPGDTSVPGVYRAVVVLNYPTAAPETFPSDDVLYILIRPSL